MINMRPIEKIEKGKEVTVTNIPNGYKPHTDLFFTTCSQGGAPVFIKIFTSGEVNIYWEITDPTNQFIRLSTSYITEDAIPTADKV